MDHGFHRGASVLQYGDLGSRTAPEQHGCRPAARRKSNIHSNFNQTVHNDGNQDVARPVSLGALAV